MRIVPPKLTIVRHAQGLHNVSRENHAIRDPGLTEKGVKECGVLAKYFPDHESVDLIVCSPLRRTVETALLGFKHDLRDNAKILALPEVQEGADMPCDTGSDVAKLKADFEDEPIDFGFLTEDWNSKTGVWAPTYPAQVARARKARQWIRLRPEQHVVLVTHGGIIHYLTEDWTDFRKSRGTGWDNVEYRTFEFKGTEDENASFRETDESREGRLGEEKPLTETEQIQLRETARQTFMQQEYHDEAGLQKRTW